MRHVLATALVGGVFAFASAAHAQSGDLNIKKLQDFQTTGPMRQTRARG